MIHDMERVFGIYSYQWFYVYCKFINEIHFNFHCRHFTREALPRLDNYRNILSIQAVYRPTLDELHNATLSNKVIKLCSFKNSKSKFNNFNFRIRIHMDIVAVKRHRKELSSSVGLPVY